MFRSGREVLATYPTGDSFLGFTGDSGYWARVVLLVIAFVGPAVAIGIVLDRLVRVLPPWRDRQEWERVAPRIFGPPRSSCGSVS